MDGLYVEYRRLVGTTLSRDIAHHLYTRQLPGLVVIVVPRPLVMMASVRKQWAVVMRQVQRQRSSTLHPKRRRELDNALLHMQSARFGLTNAEDDFMMRVVFMTQEACLAGPPECHTLYITEPTDAPLAKMTAAMRPHALVVLCEAE